MYGGIFPGRKINKLIDNIPNRIMTIIKAKGEDTLAGKLCLLAEITFFVLFLIPTP